VTSVLTHGVTFRATGLAFAPVVGVAGAAAVLEAAAAGAVTDHALYAANRNCKCCGGTFSADSPVRRTVAGGWRHDVCPRVRAQY
jgi:hypothetical protein